MRWQRPAAMIWTKEEAESYLAELADIELDGETLNRVSGGAKVCYNVLNCWTKVRNN